MRTAIREHDTWTVAADEQNTLKAFEMWVLKIAGPKTNGKWLGIINVPERRTPWISLTRTSGTIGLDVYYDQTRKRAEVDFKTDRPERENHIGRPTTIEDTNVMNIR